MRAKIVLGFHKIFKKTKPANAGFIQFENE